MHLTSFLVPYIINILYADPNMLVLLVRLLAYGQGELDGVDTSRHPIHFFLDHVKIIQEGPKLFVSLWGVAISQGILNQEFGHSTPPSRSSRWQ